MKRSRHTLKGLLAQRDPNAPRSEEEHAWLDAPPVGREFGAVPLMPLSRVRRDLNSIMRRGDTVVLTRRGECVARLEPIVTVEQMRHTIRRRGASAGVLEHVEADPNVTDDESLADAIDKRDRERNIGAELLESVRAIKAEMLASVHAPSEALLLRCIDLGPLGELTHDDLVVGRLYVGCNDGDGWFRVVDESGESFLYPSACFENLRPGSDKRP